MRLAQFLVGLIFLAGLWSAETCMAQSRPYTRYAKADGLPSDYVMRITQSPGGFMWFGTERGASRYDGQSFTTYTTDDGLPHNLVYDILEDAQGRTWFGTPAPVLTYLKNGKIHLLRDSTGSRSAIAAIAMDRNNRVFFRFSDGLGVLNGDDYQFHPMVLSTAKESNLERLADGRVVFSDNTHVLAIRLDSGTHLRLDTLLVLPVLNAFTYIKQAPDSTVYITGKRGIGKYRFAGSRLEPITWLRTGLHTTMSVIPYGYEHRLILGSRNNGLEMLVDGSLTPISTSPGSDRNFISAQFLDYEGNLWVGHFGQGVEKITTWNALIYTEKDGLAERNVWRVSTYQGNPLAMGVAGVQRIVEGRAVRLPGLPTTLRAVRGLQFAEDRVYVGTLGDLRIHSYDSRKDEIGPLIRILDIGDGINDLKLASDRSLWIASAGSKLYKLDPNGSLTTYPVKNGAERLVRAGNAMWALTSSDGAFRHENGDIRHVSKASGELPSDAVWSLHEDQNGILIGTSAGLVKITPEGKKTLYDGRLGLVGSPVIGIFPMANPTGERSGYWVATPSRMHQLVGYTLLPGNTLATLRTPLSGAHWMEADDGYRSALIGTTEGLVKYDLGRTSRSIPPPKVSILTVSIDSSEFKDWSDTDVGVRKSSATLEFSFAGLTYLSDAETRFTYRLIGIDDRWSVPQRQRSVRIANVAPGTYTFEVRAINVDGSLSAEPARVTVTIYPPWWMHPIVLVVMMLAATGALVAGIRWRLRQIRAEIVKRNEQKQFEAIQRIGASISHDIKNTVFSLSLLAKNLEKRFDNPEFRKDAIETIESSFIYLSTLINRLQDKPSSSDTLAQDIFLKRLCDDVAKRVTAGTDRRVVVDIPDTMRIRIRLEPIERILENLIRNAIEATTPSQMVRVTAQHVGPTTELFVMDEGPGMTDDFLRNRLFKPFQSTKTKGLGIGLFSSKELVDSIGATIDVESELGKGSTFRLRFVNSPS